MGKRTLIRAMLTLLPMILVNSQPVYSQNIPQSPTWTQSQIQNTFFPTGNMERDLSKSRYPDVLILTDNAKFGGAPNDVAQQAWITNQNQLNGWNFKDLRFYYDIPTDTLAVGVNFFKNADLSPINIAGDADGNGDPSTTSARALLSGGVDMPNLSGRESIAVAFDLNHDGRPDYVAGVPSDKGTGDINSFEFARYQETGYGIERSFGTKIPGAVYAYNPSSAHPDFAFVIPNFAKLDPSMLTQVPGQLPTLNYYVRAYAGTLDDVVSGEDVYENFISEQRLIVPEPSTYVFWMALAFGLGWFALQRRSAPVVVR